MKLPTDNVKRTESSVKEKFVQIKRGIYQNEQIPLKWLKPIFVVILKKKGKNHKMCSVSDISPNTCNEGLIKGNLQSHKLKTPRQNQPTAIWLVAKSWHHEEHNHTKTVLENQNNQGQENIFMFH